LILVDTHCHLDFPHFDGDREAAIARAREAGVGRIVVPGTDLASSRRAVELAEAHPEVFAAVGVHPNSTAGFGTKELKELRELARSQKVVGIGEIGIDLYWKSAPLEDQRRAFRAQIALAAELDKPVIVHDREAHAEVMTLLREARPASGVVLHAFSGDKVMAEAALALGFYLGVDGPLTYKKNEALRAIFAAAPLDRVLIETDAPYLAPQAQRGKRNEPAYVRYVAEKLAEIRGLTVEQIGRATTDNAARLFRWELVN
jgi:TatD DNase family protein